MLVDNRARVATRNGDLLARDLPGSRSGVVTFAQDSLGDEFDVHSESVELVEPLPIFVVTTVFGVVIPLCAGTEVLGPDGGFTKVEDLGPGSPVQFFSGYGELVGTGSKDPEQCAYHGLRLTFPEWIWTQDLRNRAVFCNAALQTLKPTDPEVHAQLQHMLVATGIETGVEFGQFTDHVSTVTVEMVEGFAAVDLSTDSGSPLLNGLVVR
jgi:hypothetical protein